jgi:(S)-3,5-dihydroxyphenylglycine transaminase
VDLAALRATVAELQARGKHARLLYLSPDHANPTGVSMSLQTRLRLLEATQALGLMVLEDHAYSYFCFEDERPPPLKALAGAGHVLYLGSFSKSIYPGLRLGYLVADQMVLHEGGRTTRLADELSKVKSLLTVNTSPLTQAIAAGLLARHGYSLQRFVAPRRLALRQQRDALMQTLQRHFPASQPWCEGIRWNCPSGGFFATLKLPFLVTDQDLLVSAAEFGVTWTPMSYFCITQAHRPEIRLSYSYVDPAQIEAGVGRLAAMLKARLQGSVTTPA